MRTFVKYMMCSKSSTPNLYMNLNLSMQYIAKEVDRQNFRRSPVHKPRYKRVEQKPIALEVDAKLP